MEITHRTRGSTTIIRLCGRWVCGYDVRSDLRAHIQRLIEGGGGGSTWCWTWAE